MNYQIDLLTKVFPGKSSAGALGLSTCALLRAPGHTLLSVSYTHLVEGGRTYLLTQKGHRAEIQNVMDQYRQNQDVIMSVRPEEFLLTQDATVDGIDGVVDDCVFLGLNTHYFVHLDSGEEVEII